MANVEEKTFSISEAARFFDKSVPWMRWRERTPVFRHPDGSPIVVTRTIPRRAEAGYRRYTLQNIEDFAEALLRNSKISSAEYETVMARVRAWK